MFVFKNIGKGVAHSAEITVQNEQFREGIIIEVGACIKVLAEIPISYSPFESQNYCIEFGVGFSDLAGRKYSQKIVCEVNSVMGNLPAPLVLNPVLISPHPTSQPSPSRTSQPHQ